MKSDREGIYASRYIRASKIKGGGVEKGEKMSTKKEILEYFKDINYAYNDSSRYDTLERMLSELEGEKMGNEERCVICGEIIPEGRQVCPICEARAGLSTEWEKRQIPPDYIDRRKLTAKMRELIPTRLFNEEDMLDLVNEQPRADVVEIVRCKNCLEAKEIVPGRYSCFSFAGTTDGNWYCGDGKRKEVKDE